MSPRPFIFSTNRDVQCGIFFTCMGYVSCNRSVTKIQQRIRLESEPRKADAIHPSAERGYRLIIMATLKLP